MENKFNIPVDKWNSLGENQQTFNTVYEKCLTRKNEFLTTIPSDQRTQLYPALDFIIAGVVSTAVQELSHA